MKSQSKPLVLLTNDDGVGSPYLAQMAGALEAIGAEVLIVAPERQRSAMSHTITLHKPLRTTRHAEGVYALSGTPVDCVYVGSLKLSPRPPSLVVSGPNDGFNLGTDVFYSGTVGAAVEGGLRGIPAIAVSIERKSPESIPQATHLVASLAQSLWRDPAPTGTVFNINVPHSADGRFRWTTLGKRFYADDVSERQDPRGQSYFWIGGGMAGIADIAGSDCEAVVSEGIASISPMHLNLSDQALVAAARLVEGFVCS